MNTRTVLLLCAGAIGLSADQARATDYYVRVSGSDSNNGLSAGAAFRTIDRAANVAQAGDRVYVGSGTYNETVTPSNDGTSGNRILFIADTSGAQTGDSGTVTISGGTCIDVSWDNYITFSGFTIQSSGSSTAVQNRGSAGFLLENCTVLDGGTGIRNRDGGSSTVTGCTISSASSFGAWCDQGTLAIEQTTIESSGNYSVRVGYSGTASVTITRSRLIGGYYGIRFGSGSLTMVNSVMSGTTNDGFRSQSNSNSINLYNCTIGNIGDDALDWYGTATVRNCIFFNINDDALARRSGSMVASHCLFDDIGDDIDNGVTATNSIEQDPQFIDEAGLDLRLSAGSPAIDVGMDGSSWASDDYAGTARPTGAAWDIGAYEYTNPVVYASVPYTTDFESGAGAEWTNGTTSQLSALSEFAGRYARDGSSSFLPTLHVTMTPGELHYLFFDLYTIDSWDGDHSSWGPDRLYVDIDGVREFDHSFANFDGFPSDNPYSYESRANYGYTGWPEAVYRRIFIPFTPGQSEIDIEFLTPVMEGLSNESFGLDNVMVLDEDDAQAYLPIFTDVSIASGFSIDNDSTSHAASGLLWGDVDRDGDLDVVITGLDARLLRFDPLAGTYSAQTLGSGGNVRRQGALLDPDEDGDLDFWAANVSSYNEERLFGTSGGVMTDVGSAGFSAPSNNEGLAAADVNGDGRTDIVMFSENGNWIGLNTGEDPIRFDATADSADGLTGSGNNGNGEFVASGDINNDGYPDFFYHYGGGRLFHSRGDGTYIANNRGISVRTGNSDKSGSAWGDYDNDGDLDLFSPSFRSGEAGFLHRNVGISDVYDSVSGEDVPMALFSNASSSAGIDSTAQQRSAAWGDFDNDGDLDLLVTTDSDDPLLLYENQGDATFTLVDKGAAISGELHDAVFVDYDNDGDLDISVTRENDTNVLLENSTDGDAFLKVRLVEKGENNADVDVVGARVELRSSDGSSILARRDIGVARGFGGVEPLWAHFGGVNPKATYTVKVVWPGGSESTQQVTPGSVSTTIKSTTISQMLTMTNEGSARARVIRWREVSSVDE